MVRVLNPSERDLIKVIVDTMFYMGQVIEARGGNPKVLTQMESAFVTLAERVHGALPADGKVIDENVIAAYKTLQVGLLGDPDPSKTPSSALGKTQEELEELRKEIEGSKSSIIIASR